MIKNILPLLLSIVLISGCTLPGTQSEGSDSVMPYENASLSISVPKTWKEANITSLPNPKKGVIEVAYVSEESKYGFSNNLLILSETLDTPVTSEKYSELNQLQTTKNYLEYTKIEGGKITFQDDEVSQYYIFEARYNESSPRMQFIQTARVCGTKVYVLHFSLALDKDASLYKPLLESFQCR